MNDLAGVIILYYPNEEMVLRNIFSFASHLTLLIVINNTPGSDDSLMTRLNALNRTFIYLKHEKNEGISKSLNEAANLAIQKKMNWLLTMDQDSFFEQNEAAKYFKWFQTHSLPDVAVIGPIYTNENSVSSIDTLELFDVTKLITSGSIIDLRIWQKINGFDERLFIDEVDHEYCYRAKSMGFCIKILKGVRLTHKMGQLHTAGYGGLIKRRNRMIHSPIRIYYMMRNYLYVKKKYKKLFADEFKIRDKEMLVIMKNNLFFSDQFLTTLKMIFRGYYDYRKNVFGEFLK